MVTENLQVNKVSVSCLQIKNGIYQAVLEYYDENGKRHQPWRSTKLKVRGNKKQALAVAEKIRAKLEKELQRNEKALAEAAALLVLSKKANAIWGDSEDE